MKHKGEKNFSLNILKVVYILKKLEIKVYSKYCGYIHWAYMVQYYYLYFRTLNNK